MVCSRSDGSCRRHQKRLSGRTQVVSETVWVEKAPREQRLLKDLPLLSPRRNRSPAKRRVLGTFRGVKNEGWLSLWCAKSRAFQCMQFMRVSISWWTTNLQVEPTFQCSARSASVIGVTPNGRASCLPAASDGMNVLLCFGGLFDQPVSFSNHFPHSSGHRKTWFVLPRASNRRWTSGATGHVLGEGLDHPWPVRRNDGKWQDRTLPFPLGGSCD